MHINRHFRHRPRPRGRGVVALLVLLLVFCGRGARGADHAPYERIPARRWDPATVTRGLGGPEAVARQQERTRETQRRWRTVHELLGARQVSARSRRQLAARGLGPALLGSSGKSGLQATDFQDTLRVLIVRISFETNREPDLTSIAPDGDFVLEPLADPGPLEIDPPPHDKAFYEAHLQGLSEYYRFQSGGRLQIDGRVLPEDPQGSYKVSDIADYGPGADGFWTIEDLERLVRDMIDAADAGTSADGSVNLADYDDDNPFTYIIFVHAGGDWQSDINGDSPNDIPTFFVTLGEPHALAGTDSETGEAGLLSECSIIPETTNQDGYPGSIAAAFYHEFGHALGLVDVYNTDDFTPSAGIWDLMDSGTNLGVTIGTVTAENDTVFIVANGVLPPSLGAWNKWYLGWLDMGEVGGAQRTYKLPAVEVPRDQYDTYRGISGDFQLAYPQALRAGLSPREWFLLENRWVPVGPAETPFNNLSFERDEATGVILYLAGERPPGFWRNSGLYDYFMPAGGLLVWHVNEDRIEQGLETNTINTQGDGLRLVEADGITDIGVLEAYVLGWYGGLRDPFGGYDAQGYTNDFTELYTSGIPSSRCVDRSWTGFFMHDVKPNDAGLPGVMRFEGGIEGIIGLFPWTAEQVQEDRPEALDSRSLTPVTLPDGRNMVAFATGAPRDGEAPASTYLYLLNQSGWAGLSGGPGPFGAVAELPGLLAGPPAVVSRGPGETALLWTTVNGTVGLTGLDTEARDLWRSDLDAAALTRSIRLIGADGDTVFVGFHAEQKAVALDPGDGAILGQPLDLGAAEVRGEPVSMDAGRTLALPGDDHWWEITRDAEQRLQRTDHAYPRTAEGAVRAVVLDEPDAQLLVFFDDLGSLDAWRGAAGNWSPAASPLTGEVPVSDPAAADLDGDGRNDLVLVTAERIHAVSASGARLAGWPVTLRELFPLADTTGFSGPVVVADGTGDGVNEVYVPTDGGHLLALDARGDLLPGFPLRWGDRAAAGLAVGPGIDAASPRVLWLLSSGGYAGPPRERNLVNGRVAGLQLAAPAPGDRTSEWLGAAGGPDRAGTAGTARDLGGIAPAAAQVDRAVLYPNPLGDSPLTVRFFSADDHPARFWVHNLEGEVVLETNLSALAGEVNERTVDLSQLASGLYVCRLQYSTTAGRVMRTMTLAVER